MRGCFKIKAVVFDVGGVLQLNKEGGSKKGIQETFAKNFNLNLDDYLDSIDALYARSTEGLISKKELLNSLSKNLNFPKKKIEEIYIKGYKKKFKENKGLLRIAKKLKKRGFKISILSDQWSLSEEPLIPKSFHKIFSPVIVSCDVKLRKPNKKIYLLLLKKLKLSPEEILFVDNRAWNLSPAKDLGIKTILFLNNKLFKKQLKEFLIDL
ncbi:HAD-IA family hydrolase [Candidatus Pacearchaeota archaeon]|nr:MAG: hypothetical protein QJ16_C0004G0014 [archaeon GW2011_AR1]MBS3078113.1 HAD-IA family hydrolase [Candidatus Pacearchaeota archaeon]HIH52582.1 HAD-IA family hydrolase [Nanoarchaeota archaeon]